MTDPHLEQEIAHAREKARRTLPVTLLALLGIVAMYLPLPKRFIAFAPLVLSVVLAVRLLRFLRPRRGREKVMPALALGVVGVLLSSLCLQAAFYDTFRTYEQCMDGAQTSRAVAECQKVVGGGPLGVGLIE